MIFLAKIGISIMSVCLLAMIGALLMSFLNHPKWFERAERIMKVAPLVAIIVAGFFVVYLMIGLWAGFVAIE